MSKIVIVYHSGYGHRFGNLLGVAVAAVINDDDLAHEENFVG